MTAIWPSQLPQRVLRDGFQMPTRDKRIVHQPADGRSLTHIGASRPILVPAEFRMTLPERELLNAFWIEGANEGNEPFTIPGQLTDGAGTLDESFDFMLDADGFSIPTTDIWLVKFAGNGNPTSRLPNGRIHYRVSFPLEVLIP